MTDWRKISSTKFMNAYNSYPPNRWIRFAFKYFSKSTEKEDMKLNNSIVIILLSLFGFGMVGTILGWSKAIIATSSIVYSILLAILVLFLFIAVWMNNLRIKKIAKSLNITILEYNRLASRYF